MESYENVIKAFIVLLFLSIPAGGLNLCRQRFAAWEGASGGDIWKRKICRFSVYETVSATG